jgi:glycosyltransferase involved in cell wall biosynthesis
MRVVILSETFAKNMGYMGSMLPKYLARQGVDVHVVSMDLPPYYQLTDFKETYGDFRNPVEKLAGTVEEFNGYQLHFLSHQKVFGYMKMKGLHRKLLDIKPQIVQSIPAIGWIPLDAALIKPLLGYKLFTGNHNSASTFELANKEYVFTDIERLKCFFTRTIHGRLVSLLTEKCYGVTKDCAEIAWKYYGVQRKKVEVMHLGVDTDYFFPIDSKSLHDERMKVRKELGFDNNDIVCIYTGKFTESKNANILANAIERLRSMGLPFKGLFIGEGVQKELIEKNTSSVVVNFMPFNQLGAYYRSADIGVWPTNESTSMLDAAACGIPLIVSDGIVYRDHVEGNGLVYKMNDLDNLVDTLLSLRDSAERHRLGSFGAEKMLRDFSWESVAKRRINDYEAALSQRKTRK